MKLTGRPGFGLRLSDEQRAFFLALIILLQLLCALFFAWDAIDDMIGGDGLVTLHSYLEVVATVSLIGGVGFLMVELRNLMRRMGEMDRGIRAARGDMAQLIQVFFDEWGLTRSESDVAMMVLKGVDNESIANMRGTARGTVRAQCASIYAKAGVDGRSQLFSIFMEELLNGEMEEAET